MSELLNKKYTLEIKVLSPLHIGAGSEKDWMEGADFIQKDEKIYKLNHKKLEKKIDVDTLSDFLIKKDSKGLVNKISGNIEEVSDEIFDSPVQSTNDIKAFIKNGLSNKPIIPGSSLKGAIRSILFKYLKENYQKYEDQVFGTPNNGDEFMRFIKIFDSQFEETELVNTKIFNLFEDGGNWKGGWKHKGGKFGITNSNFEPTGFNTIYEIISPEQYSEFTISLAYKALDNLITIGKFNVSEKKKNIINNNLENNLFSIINSHTKKYINKEIKFFEKYPNNETDKIIDSLNFILNEIPDDNSSCVLKMSAGSGFHSITGDWQFDDFSINAVDKSKRNRGLLNGKPSSKSRKIATDGNKFELMGFVKLTVLPDEIIKQREAERFAKIEVQRKSEAEKSRKEQEEKQRAEAERLAKIEAEQKAKEKKIAEEKRKREESEAEQKRNVEQLKKRQQDNIKKKEDEKQKLKKQGLAKQLAEIPDFNTGKDIIAKYKNKVGEIPETEYDAIKQFLIHTYQNAPGGKNRWRKIKKSPWGLISSWVGKEITQEWYNEIIK